MKKHLDMTKTYRLIVENVHFNITLSLSAVPLSFVICISVGRVLLRTLYDHQDLRLLPATLRGHINSISYSLHL